MLMTRRSSLLSYAIAILSVIAAVMLTWSLWPLIERSVFLFFIIAVMLSAWRGGHGPGLVATILSAVLGDYFFLPPLHTIGPFDPQAALPLFLFTPVALLVSIFTAESQRARKGLAETSETLEAVVDASPLAIIAVDTDGNIRTWNPAAERIFGWSAQEVIGRPNPIVPKDKQDEYCEFREQAARSSGFTTREAVRVKKGGSVINLSLSIAALRGEQGAYTGSMAVIADITEQKRSEEALRRTETQYRELVECVQAIVWRGDAKTFQFSFVSKEAETLLGYPVERWLNEPAFWRDHIHPEDREWAVSFCARATADKQSHEFEYRMIAADGRVIWLRDIVRVTVEEGEPKDLVGVMIDITDRNRAEEALQESEQRFRATFEQAAVGIGQVTRDGKLLMVNQKFCDLLGYTEAELLDRTISDITRAEDIELSLRNMERLWAGEVQASVIEKLYVRKDGSL
ncbi:MAG TPA: PAS domain S-box protein, partial [Blastocatellia bacterium]|nr:PAS domain S-box protein [Blastocatellia bacterium]